MKKLEKKHPLAVRWLHWISFPLLAMMIWSGILIYWANAVYSIKIFGYELFHFFPAGFYKPTQLTWLTNLLGGYNWARWEHFWLMILFVVFFVVHVIQVALAGWSNFSSMITGYEIVPADEKPVAPVNAEGAKI